MIRSVAKMFVLVSPLLVLNSCSSAPRVPFEPFPEEQFGSYLMLFEGLELHLGRSLTIHIEEPQDVRNDDYVPLEDFWLQESGFGSRTAQPLDITEYLQAQLVRAIDTLGDVSAESSTITRDDADVVLRCSVHDAWVSAARFSFSSKYSSYVEVEIDLVSPEGVSLLEDTLWFDASLDKPIEAKESGQHNEIKPLLGRTFQQAFQDMLFDPDFLLAVRQAGRKE